MKRILSIFLIILLFCVTILNGETKRINKKALRRMIKHMTTIKNLLRNLQLDRDLQADGSSSESESSESESSGSESSGSDPSGSEPSGSEPSGSEPSGSESSGSEGSGSEGSEGSGSEASEGSESEGSEGSKSEASEGSGSEASEGSGSEASEGSESEASEGSESEASEGSESQSLEESESSPSSPNITAPLTANPDFTGRRRTRINILAFNSFKRGNKSISFVVFFLFTQPPFYRIITFILTIRYFKRNRFRYLQEDKNETVTCNAQSDITEGKNARYSCHSSINGNSDDIEQVAIADINIPGVSSLEEISFNDEALLASSNLQNFVDEVNNMYDLKNGELKYSNNYFVIKGDIDDYQGKTDDEFRLRVYDNSSGIGILKNASCSVQSITNKKYQFKCTSDKDIDGYIHLASMYDDNKNAINLYMNEGNETLSFKGNGNNGNIQRSNPIYKKSSSGLSGGAIAGIVIACAVVLIIASIIAMMLRKPSVPIKNNSSITELRSIDNYTQ